jgi:protein tyrosine/serine phosphatase
MPSPLPTILNLRDVGETVNTYSKSSQLSTHRLYRSARPDNASTPDREALKTAIGIKTIIDLRTTTEHMQQSSKRDALIKAQSSALAPKTEEDVSRPLQIPGIDYVLISFTGSAYSRYLMSQLSWKDTVKLIGLMAIGRRMEAISILGTNVMRPTGLAGLAIASVDVCGKEVKEVFDVLADEARYPVLVHCTQGKDRTGLVVQLVLMLMGVSLDVVKQDYMMSTQELEPEKEERLKEIHAMGLTDEFAACDPELSAKVDAHIHEKFGSVEKYLEGCGVTMEMQEKVKKILGGLDFAQNNAE